MRISTASPLLALLLASLTLTTGIVGQVLTPGGYRSIATVYELPPGGSLAHVGSEVHVLASDGNVVDVANANAGVADTTEPVQRDLLDGWIAFAWWLNPGLAPIASFSTTWEVPPAPETDHGQTVFLFNALQPNDSSAILQPVLQYGPRGFGDKKKRYHLQKFFSRGSLTPPPFPSFHIGKVVPTPVPDRRGRLPIRQPSSTACRRPMGYNSGFPVNPMSAILISEAPWYGPSNAGGGSFWTAATWYVDGTGNAFFTTPVPVSPGQTLNGIIALTESNGSTFNYNAQFTNVPGTSINVTGAPQFTFAAETLEAYGVTSLSDYPSGSTVFSGIDLVLVGGGKPSLAWSHEDDTVDAVLISVDGDGATDARMTITY
ncbi:hypothetical protein B0H12DRAFT_1073701 [Mycena haematopus]|nr:hypothetical protein B0H12DRAFT_1073701 [Mycena haematopus]